ncbi:MAG: hypothetical protein EB072_18925 [Betaproteobacteria bacterium]|nr:hypothetical protein [Betaproteobacteria bacterium]
MTTGNIGSLLIAARDLRRQRRFSDAFHLLHEALPVHENLRPHVWQHQPSFWQSFRGGGLCLRRRSADDAQFIREVCSNAEFVNRYAPAGIIIPLDERVLSATLDAEFVACIHEVPAVHWIVEDSHGRKLGLASLVDISVSHRRAELLLGVTAEASPRVTVRALLLIFYRFFASWNMYKLYGYILNDNHKAIDTALNLGFRCEGTLLEHIADTKTGLRKTLVIVAATQSDVGTSHHLRLATRLLANKPSKPQDM